MNKYFRQAFMSHEDGTGLDGSSSIEEVNNSLLKDENEYESNVAAVNSLESALAAYERVHYNNSILIGQDTVQFAYEQYYSIISGLGMDPHEHLQTESEFVSMEGILGSIKNVIVKIWTKIKNIILTIIRKIRDFILKLFGKQAKEKNEKKIEDLSKKLREQINEYKENPKEYGAVITSQYVKYILKESPKGLQELCGTLTQSLDEFIKNEFPVSTEVCKHLNECLGFYKQIASASDPSNVNGSTLYKGIEGSIRSVEKLIKGKYGPLVNNIGEQGEIHLAQIHINHINIEESMESKGIGGWFKSVFGGNGKISLKAIPKVEIENVQTKLKISGDIIFTVDMLQNVDLNVLNILNEKLNGEFSTKVEAIFGETDKLLNEYKEEELAKQIAAAEAKANTGETKRDLKILSKIMQASLTVLKIEPLLVKNFRNIVTGYNKCIEEVTTIKKLGGE